MRITGATHWFGVFLLFISFILLLLTTLSAPIINSIGLLKVHLTNGTVTHHSAVSFGTFGYCILHGVNNDDWCTHHHLGYHPSSVMSRIDATDVSRLSGGTADGLTHVMVLHPITCALAFTAFLTSLGAGIVGSLIGGLVALVAWILTLVVMATDFTVFGIVKHHVNHDGRGSHAYYGSGIWMVVASFVLLFIGMLLVFGTCLSARKARRRDHEVRTRSTNTTTVRRKKRFGIF